MNSVAREAWTDERLDDLNQRVTEGFQRVDADIRALRQMMFQGFITMTGIMITGFVTLAGLQIF
jgi:hypothetical protein